MDLRAADSWGVSGEILGKIFRPWERGSDTILLLGGEREGKKETGIKSACE